MSYVEVGTKIIYNRYAGDCLPMNPPRGYFMVAQYQKDSQNRYYATDTTYALKFNAPVLYDFLENVANRNKTIVACKWKAKNGDNIYFHLARTNQEFIVQCYLENTTQHVVISNVGLNLYQSLYKIMETARNTDPKYYGKVTYYVFFGRGARQDYLTENDWHNSLQLMGWSDFNNGKVDTSIEGFNAFHDAWLPFNAYDTGDSTAQAAFNAFDGVIKEEEEQPDNTDPASPSNPADPFPEYMDDEIPLPDLPVDTALSSDFLKLYHLDDVALSSLASVLWSDDFFENILKNYDSPFENIVSLNILPVDVSGSSRSIRIGNYDTNVLGDEITTQFVDLDGGSVYVDRLRDNQLDFEPARSCQIYIPFIGYRQIDLDDLSGGWIQLHYRLDLLTGNLLAMLQITQDPTQGGRYAHNSVEYFFNGNCATSVPVSGANYMLQYSNMLNGAMSASTGLVTGSISGAVGGASSVMNNKPAYMRSGQLSGNVGFMGQMTAFLLLSSPIPHIPANARNIVGYRSMIYWDFGSLSGYAEIESFHPSADLAKECTEEELNEIETLLKGGVIF